MNRVCLPRRFCCRWCERCGWIVVFKRTKVDNRVELCYTECTFKRCSDFNSICKQKTEVGPPFFVWKLLLVLSILPLVHVGDRSCTFLIL